MKTNPTYNYMRMSQVNVDEIPAELKSGFKNPLSDGIICECRVKVSVCMIF